MSETTKQGYAYGLVCPVSGAIRYVGCSNNPFLRLAQHFTEARRSLRLGVEYRGPHASRQLSRFYPWLDGLRLRGVSPSVVVLMACPLPDKFFWEAFWGEILADGGLLNDKPFNRHRIASK